MNRGKMQRICVRKGEKGTECTLQKSHHICVLDLPDGGDRGSLPTSSQYDRKIANRVNL